SDIVNMASYAPLFVNANDRRWNPDAIVFNSFQHYGTPSYWMQLFFSESNGATFLNSTLQATASNSLIASAITWENSADKKTYIRIKAVNFGASSVNLKISFNGLDPNSLQSSGSSKTVLTSPNLMDENSFVQPKKVAPINSLLQNVGKDMNVVVPPHSFTSLDLLKASSNLEMPGTSTTVLESLSNMILDQPLLAASHIASNNANASPSTTTSVQSRSAGPADCYAQQQLLATTAAIPESVHLRSCKVANVTKSGHAT
ncbi:alpha-L-arabinofuranosidase 1-like protein, partial [Trifolium pratense]